MAGEMISNGILICCILNNGALLNGNRLYDIKINIHQSIIHDLILKSVTQRGACTAPDPKRISTRTAENSCVLVLLLFDLK